VEESGQETHNLKGEIIDPGLFLKVINHDLRKQILHELFILSMEEPITKSQIAEKLGLGYHKMLYQLTNHLNYFWKVDYEKKVRGAREEYISPVWMNSIYCILGADAAVHIIDPLANIYGKLSDVGTRCDNCDPDQVKKCWEKVKDEPCIPQTDEVLKKKQIILMVNDRFSDPTPVDQFLICTLIKSLENEPCEINLDCRDFLKRQT